MIREINLTNDAITSKIHALAQSAYAVEAALIGCPDFPPLRESPADLQECGDRFLVWEALGQIIGALSFHEVCAEEAQKAHGIAITRLVVSPAHLRQGIAIALHTALERRVPARSYFSVSTAQANEPAVALYKKLGYAVTSLGIAPEGIPLVHFRREGLSEALNE